MKRKAWLFIMTKFEFLGDLSRMISILPEEERDSAMEYYEDYFADAGPENEAQIIDEFGSPELVARQILLSSSVGNADSLDAMLAAAAAAAAPQAVAPTPIVPLPPQNMSSQTPVQQTAQAAPAQAQAAAPAPAPTIVYTTAPAPGTESNLVEETLETEGRDRSTITLSVPDSELLHLTPREEDDELESSSNKMRNPIFQAGSTENSEAEEAALDRAKRMKINVKSIDNNTADIERHSKKDKSIPKQKVELNSGKVIGVAIVALITCPIWLCILGVILGFLVLVATLSVALAVGTVVAIISSVACVAMGIFVLINSQIGNALFAIGTGLILFPASFVILWLAKYLFTRSLPNVYHNIRLLLRSVKHKITEFAAE